MIYRGDCIKIPLDDKSVDMVLTSPPYEDMRTYGIHYSRRGDAWVRWAVPRFLECKRVCRSLVAWVVAGRTRNKAWSATPFKLVVTLMERGVTFQTPIIWHRTGRPGSGGKDDLRNDHEYILRSADELEWADVYCDPPKCGVGGRTSNWVGDKRVTGSKVHVDLVNPGNVQKWPVGGGHLGHHMAHLNEAPFPLSLATWMIQRFCKPGGTVLDPMCGSGTVGHAAILCGRKYILGDLRYSQVALAERRLEDV